jgi:hypothetical protein
LNNVNNINIAPFYIMSTALKKIFEIIAKVIQKTKADAPWNF